MERVGIPRQHLSRYASRVRTGESFVLTDRGEAVARLVPAAGRGTALDRLVADRGARRADGDLLALLPPVEELATGRPSADCSTSCAKSVSEPTYADADVIYLDTSAFVKLVVAEHGSAELRTALLGKDPVSSAGVATLAPCPTPKPPTRPAPARPAAGPAR